MTIGNKSTEADFYGEIEIKVCDVGIGKTFSDLGKYFVKSGRGLSNLK